MIIPSGNVTFLFTDIEGSTMLAQKHAGEYQTALQKHDEILTGAVESYGGFIFKKVGDAFCAAFTKCEDAITATLKIQKSLTEEFKDEIEMKVRMGIHKGIAEYSNGDYMGYVTLSRAQRIMSVAHGGQILLTREAHDSVQYSENLNISFRDFGERKLKDIILPEHIFQLVSAGLQTDFPPLKSQDARQNNLPTSLSKFIGRRTELNEIKKMFANTRLITLTGAGGTGKTRLAVQFALEILDEFEHGVWIVELSPVTNTEFVVKEISNALNVKENPGEDLLKTLKDFLMGKNLLLLFDNSEHLLTKCAPVAEDILIHCNGIKIISTSREPFNISGETVYRVPPLSVPNKIKNEKLETLKEYESIKLFLDRAASVNSSFKLTESNITAIAELCKKLDGIPLAIELASKRINVLTVEKILERLSDRFKLLTSGSPTALPRQKTLRAMIDWSYDLLHFNEQLLLQRLSVFMGGWTLEAAEEICSDDDMISKYDVLDLSNSLLDKSLINFTEENGQPRYVMLETIKEYSMEKLTDKLNDFQKHTDYFLNLTDFEIQFKNGIEQPEWTNLVETELDNVRISIERSVTDSQLQSALLCINMYSFWTNKGYFNEGYDTITKVLENVTIEDKKVKAELMEKAAQFCYMNGKFDKLEELAGEALKISREVNYKEGIINALNAMSLKSYIERNYDYTIKLCEEALVLCKEIQSNSHTATLLLNLSFPVSSLGDKEKALELRKEALELFRIEKNYNSVAETLMGLSIDEVRFRSDFDKAMEYSEESLSILKKTKNNYLTSLNLINLGSLELLHKKDLSNAEYMLLEAYKLCMDYGYNMNKLPARIFLGVLYMELEQYDKAIYYLANNIRERETPGGRFFYLDSVSILMKIKYKMNQYENAAVLFGFENFLADELNMKLALSNLKLNLLENKDLIEKLGEEKFNTYWSKGRKMSLEEGEEFALLMSNIQ